MHAFAHFVVLLVTPLVKLSSTFAPIFDPLCNGGRCGFAMAALVVSAALVVIGCALWAMAERIFSARLRRNLRAEILKSGGALAFREALLSSAWDAVVVLGPYMREPLSLGHSGSPLKSCLKGADAARLARDMDALIRNGIHFDGTFRDRSGNAIDFSGRIVCGKAVLFSKASMPRPRLEKDWRAVLDAVPAPIWARDVGGKLTFANRAFLEATGNASLNEARAMGAALERTEFDLFFDASEQGGTARARRFVAIEGRRRVLDIQVSRMDANESIAMAVNGTEETDDRSELVLENAAHRSVIEQLGSGVAVFGPDRRITLANPRFRFLFGLSEAALQETHSFDELLDRLRTVGRIPELLDFPAWKRRMVALFDGSRERSDETWHLPNGRSIRVTWCPHPLGGLTFLFDDLTNELEFKSAYSAAVKSQRATLDTMEEAIAVFSADGRLKLHNAAFALLWRMKEHELASRPHIKEISEICEARIGPDETWLIVIAAVNSAEPDLYDPWSTIKRADGHIITLALTRLPDGTTMAKFSDLSDLVRLETALKKGEAAA